MSFNMDQDHLYQFDWTEYAVFATILGLSAIIGVYFGFIKKAGQNTVSGYLYGGKKMATFPITMSLVSTFTSSNTMLGVPTETYLYGGQYMMTFMSCIIMALTMEYIFVPVFYKLQLLSLYEYFELRFCRKVRIVATLIYSISMITYVPIVIYGPAIAINQVSGIDVHILTWILCSICIFYTTVGGLKAVVWADALQGTMMVTAILTVATVGVYKSGGIAQVYNSAEEGGRLNFLNFNPDLTARFTFWTALFGTTVLWTGGTAVNPASIQRFLSMPNRRQTRWSILWLCLGSLLFTTGSGIIGLIMYAHYKSCDPYTARAVTRPDQMVPYFVLDVARKFKGLPGMYLSGIVCASLSTMSSCLNTVAGAIYKDFIEPNLNYKVSENRASVILKFLAAFFGLVCVLLVYVVEHFGAILEISASFSGMTTGTILGLFILGLFFPSGAMYGGVCSLAVMAWVMAGYRIYADKGFFNTEPLPLSVSGCSFNLTDPRSLVINTEGDDDIFPLFKISIFYYSVLGFLVVLIVGVVVSYLTGPNDPKDVNRDLLSPLIHKYLPESSKYSSVPLKVIKKCDQPI